MREKEFTEQADQELSDCVEDTLRKKSPSESRRRFRANKRKQKGRLKNKPLNAR